MGDGGRQGFDANILLAKMGGEVTNAPYKKDEIVFTQGDRADSVFYLNSGKVKVTVVSTQGKEAVVAILDAGDFFGEGCLAGQLVRMASIAAMTDCSVVRIDK